MTAPTVSATSGRSPVTITMRRMPLRRKARMVLAASGRMGSSSTSTPAGAPSTATNTVREPSSWARRRAALAQAGAPVTPTQAALPRATGWPPTRPRMPWPGTSTTSSGSTSWQWWAAAASTTAWARTCGETWSSEPARARISSGGRVPAGTTAARAGRPLVRVPVLSMSRVVHLARRSSTAPPLITMPRRAARDRPETSATGAARISGQGVATTSTATARAAPPIAQATPAVTRVTPRNHRA